MILLINPIAPVTAASFLTAAAGYPATNALNSQILRPWKSSSNAANADALIVDLGTPLAITAVAVTQTNFSRFGVYADNTTFPTTVLGTLNTAQDAQGRYKGSLVASATARYINFKCPSSLDTPVDGNNWTIGAVYVYTTAPYTTPRDPLFGSSSLDLSTPQSRIDLDNGSVVRDTTGPSFQTINLDFTGGAGDDHEQIQQYTRAGICWLNLSNPSAPWEQWPVRHIDPKITRKLAGFNRELVSISLKEEV